MNEDQEEEEEEESVARKCSWSRFGERHSETNMNYSL